MKPEKLLCGSAFFSYWGDRMWNFAVGLYLIKITPGSLQLTAIYGLVLSLTAVVFAPVVGDWVDQNKRLKVIRITLVLQNLLVIVCAMFILMYLFDVAEKEYSQKLLQAAIIVAGSAANLASQGERIALTKDWIVVICKDSKDLLAKTNAVLRGIDLTLAIAAPITVGLLMTVISDFAGIVFMCSWNIVSMVAEYMLLVKVYNLVPDLAVSKLQGKSDKEIVAENIECKTISRDDNDNCQDRKNHVELPNVVISEKDNSEKTSKSNLNILYRLKTILSGWQVYWKQSVSLAGVALAMLYLTVVGFNSVTSGYAYDEGLSELYVSISFGLGSVVGVAGAFLFPKIRSKVGLPKTGIVGFFLQWSMLILCVASIWAPGSPSNLYNDRMMPQYTTVNSSELLPKLNNVTGQHNISNISNTTSGTNNSNEAEDQKSFLSIILLMSGMILSRAGLYVSDLTISQLQQENVPESERGAVGGVQYSFNCILDLAQFALAVILPKPAQFGILILISFGGISMSGIIYMIFCVRYLKKYQNTGERMDDVDT